MAATPETTEGPVEVANVTLETKGIDVVMTPDIHSVAINLQRAKDAYMDFAGIEEQPSNVEIILWHIYEFCSYFVHAVLIPIVFPLIISQTVDLPPPPPQGWNQSLKGMLCNVKEMKLYQSLTYKSIEAGNYKVSPLELTALSWAAGILVSTPILGYVGHYLDRGRRQNLVFGGATALGALLCLPTGFFRVAWILPPYIVVIVVASMITFASHTRHLGLMVHGFSINTEDHHYLSSSVSHRGSIAGWLSLHATAVGSLGAAIISAFTFHMLDSREKLVSLWVVSIFSGLKWIVGTVHAFSVNRPGTGDLPGANSKWFSHLCSVFKYQHAVGSLTSILLSSFTSNCIFTGALLYIVGQICVKPVFVLFLWLIYFIFPLFALPLLHPLQQLAKTDAVRMQLLGFLVTATISGLGFYYRHGNWHHTHLLFLVAIQSTAAGILHAFTRVLLLDCTPPKKEGAFSVWFAWVRAVGACAGFSVASALRENVRRSFSITFCTSMAGVLVLILGKISNNGGAIAAGHVWQEEEDDYHEDLNSEKN